MNVVLLTVAVSAVLNVVASAVPTVVPSAAVIRPGTLEAVVEVEAVEETEEDGATSM